MMITTTGKTQGTKRKNRAVLIILLGVFAVSMVLGSFAFRRLVGSEKSLSETFETMKAKGAGLSPEQCADEVIAWRKTCDSMDILCTESVSRFVTACFQAQDRRSYCASLGDSSSSTRFDYRNCNDRATDRAAKKACAIAFRTIDANCKELMRKAAS